MNESLKSSDRTVQELIPSFDIPVLGYKNTDLRENC